MTTEIIPDRPWASREYGRLRLNEAFSDELFGVLSDELDDLHSVRIDLKAAGRSVTEINRRIRRVSTIRSMLHGMMHEKGWCNCEGAKGAVYEERTTADGVRADDRM